MSLVLNTNIDALIAQNSLTTSGSQLTTALQQLSSGLQINSAADNAAGYAIAQGMTSQINGLNTATNNTNDGVSLTQTAQGSLQQITNDLQTMRNLAVQSLNATNSSQDRVDLNQQFQQLSADINQVAQTASFNGVNLLDGSFQGATFQIGANAGQTITVASVSSAQANNLGQLYTSTSPGASAYTSTGATGGAAVANGDAGSFTVNFGNNTYTTGAVSLTGSQATDLKTIAAAITQATGNGGVVATVNSAGTGINLSSTTAQPVSITYARTTGSETLSTFGLSQYNTLGGFTAAGTGVTSAAYAALGMPAASTTTQTASGTAVTGTTATTPGDTGTITINGHAANFTYGSTAGASVTAAEAAVNALTTTTGVTATVGLNGGLTLTATGPTAPTVAYSNGLGNTGGESATTIGLNTTFAASTTTNTQDTGTFSVVIGTGSSAKTVGTGPVTLTGNQAADLAAVASAISTAAGVDGVTASVNSAGTAINLSSNTSQTVTVSATFAGGGTSGAAKGTETVASFGFAGAAGSTAITAAVSAGSTVNTSNVLSVDSSNQVLIQMDAALQQIATTGAQLGAYQNRFQAAVTGLQTDSQNLSAAKSQIVDTNYALATSNLSKAQILQQASTSMVAQANTIPQNILTLLQKLP